MVEVAPINSHGIRLLEQFERGPGGKPAEVAYLCDGNRWTLWLGTTSWPNGDPVKPGDVCTPEQGAELTQWMLREYSSAVDALVTREPTPNQRAAFTMLAINIGVEAFRTSTVLARFNAGDSPRRVADAFGLWCKATSAGPNKYDLDDPYYTSIIGRNAKGGRCWIGPDGQPCKYQRALPGLLRRHLSEALLSLNLPWVQACRKDTVSIVSQRVWDPLDKRWEDRVRSKTELADVLPTAERYTLDAPTESAEAPAVILAPTEPARVEASPAPLPDSLPGPSFEGIPTQLPLPSPVEDEDELFLDTPAAPFETDAKGAAPSPATQPEVARAPSHVKEAGKTEHDEGVVSKIPPILNTNPVPSVELSGPGTGPAAAEKVAPRPSAPPVPVPAPAPPKPPPVIAPKSIDIRSIPYGEIDPVNPPATNMSDSRRVIGMVVVGAGSLVQILAAREVISSSIGAIFFDMSRDPVVVALFAGGVMWCVGWLTRKRGTQIVTKGMAEAKSVLK